MRRKRRKPKKIQKPQFHYWINEKIIADKVRVIDEEDGHLGIMPLAEALNLAKQKELDLVNINPSSDPPTVKIIDFGRFKYQKEKELKKNKNVKITETKGIRLSSRIGKHDLDVRLEQAKKFLEKGDKLKIEIILRGRERQHADVAQELISDFIKKIEEEIELKIEQPSKRQGSQVTAIVDKKNK